MSNKAVYADYQDEKRRKPVRWWHDAIIDDMLIHPLDTVPERAKRLGYTENYMSVILNSDLFKAAYAARRSEFNVAMAQAISNKMGEVAVKGLDVLLETIEKKRDAIPFAVLSDTVDKTLNRLGYGVKPAGAPVVQVNASGQQVGVVVSSEQLAEARQALRAAEAQRALETPTHPPVAPVEVSPLLELAPEPEGS